MSYEAEAAGNELASGARVAPMDGASGGDGVYAIGGTNAGQLTFTGVTVDAAGSYLLTIYYQNPDSWSRTAVVDAGSTTATLTFASTGGCCVRTLAVTVSLKAGTNPVTVGNPDSRAPDIDRIVVSAGTG